MAKFWQKKYTSKYTGAEIDAAVAKAGNLPATTSADAGKALVVDEEGKIVAGEAGGANIIPVDNYTDIFSEALTGLNSLDFTNAKCDYIALDITDDFKAEAIALVNILDKTKPNIILGDVSDGLVGYYNSYINYSIIKVSNIIYYSIRIDIEYHAGLMGGAQGSLFIKITKQENEDPVCIAQIVGFGTST